MTGWLETVETYGFMALDTKSWKSKSHQSRFLLENLFYAHFWWLPAVLAFDLKVDASLYLSL